MTSKITARKTSVKDSFKERVEKKLKKLDCFFGADANAIVVVTNEGERETVEVTVHAGSLLFRAEKTTGDRLDSLDMVVESLIKQIVKNKNKLESKHRHGGLDYTDMPSGDFGIEDEFNVVRTKRFTVKPMSVEEAILQMNMLGHTFFMFRDSATSEISVVYKRKNGDYGLLEADNN